MTLGLTGLPPTGCRFAMLLLAMLLVPGLAVAQQGGLPSLDVLRGLLQGQGLSASPSDQLDRLRQQPGGEQLAPVPAPEALGPSPDELAAFEAYCRGQEAAQGQAQPRLDPARFSRLEQDYCRRAAAPLSQFGYETFARGVTPSTLGIGSIPEHYMLGVGDELIVTFYGQTKGTYTVRVDSEGRVVVPDLQPIAAAGRRFDEFRRELEARTEAAFLGTKVFVSVGAVRQISVTVIGEVAVPGIHRLTALSTVLDAVALAGGIRKTGSLRRLKVLRNGGPAIEVDLYDLLLSGRFADRLSLFDGDRIFVPTIGATVAVAGEVTRPGIYELPAGAQRLEQSQLLAYAGGTLRPTGHSYLRVSFSGEGREEVTQSRRPGGEVAAGDLIVVRPLADVQTDSVRLLGAVTQPGQVALAYAPTVRALLGDALSLKPGAYRPFAVLERYERETGARRLQAVDLERVLSGAGEVKLRDRDTLFVLGAEDVAYLGSSSVRDVVLGRPVPGLALQPPPGQGMVPPPLAGGPAAPYGATPYGPAPYGSTPYGSAPYGTAPYGPAPYGGMAYGGTAYGGTTDAYGRTAAAGARPSAQAPYGSAAPYASPAYGAGSYGRAAPSAPAGAGLAPPSGAFGGGGEQAVGACAGIESLARIFAAGETRRFEAVVQAHFAEDRVEYRLDPPCPALFQSNGYLLPFALEHVAAVLGDVQRPGLYPVLPETALATLVAAAGGLRQGGGGVRLELSRAPKSGTPLRLQREGDAAALRLRVGPADVVRFAGSWVELAGAVQAPGLRPLSDAGSVKALVGDRSALAEDPYLPFAVLETTDAATQSRRLYPVNLERVLDGEADVALRDKDRLVVLSRDDVRYLMSTDVKNIILGQPVAGLTSARSTLEQLRQQARSEQSGQLEGSAQLQDAGKLQGGGQPEGSAPQVQGQVPAVAPAGGENICPGLKALAMVVSVGKTQRYDSALLAGLSESTVEFDLRRECPKVFAEDPDILPFALEHAVAMNGEIRHPGAYPIAPKTRLSSLISVADGVTRDTDLMRVEISRLERGGEGGSERRSMVDIGSEDPRQVLLSPSDIVRFNASYADRDSGPVVLDGEITRPGLYVIRKGERLSELIARAGGLSPQAFPYGAIFTRERVKEAEAEALKRAAREIDAALSVLASKSSVDPKQLAAVTQLSRRLDTAEAIGRVVIEADPTVLQAHPELDTVLEAGDRLFVPKRPNYVTISGDVLNPSSVQFTPGLTGAEYIRRAGGYQVAADESRVFVVLPNGEARQMGASAWNFQPVQIPPGSTIVVPRDPQPFDLLEAVRDITPILSNLAVTAASLSVISRR
jgi:protein involved in polysaccharide export with SLBB domain